METILVVDDEPTILGLCQKMLRLGGYDVTAAATGEEALRFVENKSAEISLALLDVMLPGMSGVELATRIRAESPNTTIVLMTGYRPEEISNVLGNASYPIIWKPFKTESLLRMVENALGSSPTAST